MSDVRFSNSREIIVTESSSAWSHNQRTSTTTYRAEPGSLSGRVALLVPGAVAKKREKGRTSPSPSKPEPPRVCFADDDDDERAGMPGCLGGSDMRMHDRIPVKAPLLGLRYRSVASNSCRDRSHNA